MIIMVTRNQSTSSPNENQQKEVKMLQSTMYIMMQTINLYTLLLLYFTVINNNLLQEEYFILYALLDNFACLLLRLRIYQSSISSLSS